MYSFEQQFLIKSKKPLTNKDGIINSLTLTLNTTIDTLIPLDEDEDLFGLFIDREYKPNVLEPLLLIPMPNTKAEILSQAAFKERRHTFKYYKNIDVSYGHVQSVEIDKEEFYSIVGNDLHFLHKDNQPCTHLRM